MFYVGLLSLTVSTALASTACIFDQSTYQGGGRLGRAATAQQEKVDGPPDEEEESSSSSSGDVPDAFPE